jgi:hypothetical protein
MLAVRFEEVEMQGFDGQVDFFAHFLEPVFFVEPEADALETVGACCERDAGLADA